LNPRPSGYETLPDRDVLPGREAFRLVRQARQAPAVPCCFPMFTGGAVHHWYIAGVRTRFIVDTVAPVAA
jgi:hypothetical protein